MIEDEQRHPKRVGSQLGRQGPMRKAGIARHDLNRHSSLVHHGGDRVDFIGTPAWMTVRVCERPMIADPVCGCIAVDVEAKEDKN